jgi:hypothetical protein
MYLSIGSVFSGLAATGELLHAFVDILLSPFQNTNQITTPHQNPCAPSLCRIALYTMNQIYFCIIKQIRVIFFNIFPFHIAI